MEDLMMGMVGEEPPEVKQEANATSGQEAGTGTSSVFIQIVRSLTHQLRF